jgi:hypothetical protein
MLCPTFNSRFAPEAEIVLLHKQTMSLSQKIVLCNVLGLIPPSPRLLTIGQLM